MPPLQADTIHWSEKKKFRSKQLERKDGIKHEVQKCTKHAAEPIKTVYCQNHILASTDNSWRFEQL